MSVKPKHEGDLWVSFKTGKLKDEPPCGNFFQA